MNFELYKPPDVEAAWEAWGANCGPASLAALAGISLTQLRPFLGDFERRRYMNPTHMRETCAAIGLPIKRSDSNWPGCSDNFALTFVQWGGPWLKPGVPVGAAYRNTHWVTVMGAAAYDVNLGHWVLESDWADPREGVAAAIAKQVPRCDGSWYVRVSLYFDARALFVWRQQRGSMAVHAARNGGAA